MQIIPPSTNHKGEGPSLDLLNLRGAFIEWRYLLRCCRGLLIGLDAVLLLQQVVYHPLFQT